MARIAIAFAVSAAIAGALTLLFVPKAEAGSGAAVRALRAQEGNGTLASAAGAAAAVAFRMGASAPGAGARASKANITSARPHTQVAPCLCLFDIDRTLTGMQGDTCGGLNTIIRGVYDPAYGGGDLTLSALGAAGVDSTFCGGCKVGLISERSQRAPEMRERIANGVLGGRAGSIWSTALVASPLVAGCFNAYRAACAERILQWYGFQGTRILPENVYYFDDEAMAIGVFRGKHMNVHQVSCGSRAGWQGRCGATPEEIRNTKGIHLCNR